MFLDGTNLYSAWGEQRGTYGGPVRVRTFHDGRLATLYDGEAQVAAPYLRNGWVAFLKYGETRSLLLARVGAEPAPIADGPISMFALSDESAWWIDEGRVMRYDLASGKTSTVHEGNCGELVADGKRAAAVCGDEGADGGYIAWPGVPARSGGPSSTMPAADDLTFHSVLLRPSSPSA